MSNKTIGPSALLSINDAAALRVKGLTLDIKPGQDLNGYDHPWIGGCGKNLWSPLTTTKTHEGITYTQNNNGSVKVNGTAEHYSYTQNIVTLPAGTYTLSIGTTTDIGPRISVRNNSTDEAYVSISKNSQNFTLSNDTEVRLRFYVAADTTVNNAVIWPMLRLASNTDDNFEPYENICPINGWTGADIIKCGRNIIGQSGLLSSLTINGITATLMSDGTSYTLNGTATARADLYILPYNSRNYAWQPASYIISVNTGLALNNSDDYLIISIVDNKDTIRYITTKSSKQFTIASNEKVRGCFIRVAEGKTLNNVIITPQIEISSAYTPYPYEPYTNITTSISWQSTAGTVYGGTLDVVNKELTVTHVLWENNTANMDNSETYPGWKNSGIRALIGEGKNKIFSDQILNIGTAFSANTTYTSNDVIFFSQINYNKTQTEWKALALDVQILIELATPITYSLTDDQFITLFQGFNNLWSKCGDLTLTYKPLQLDKIVDSEQLDEAMGITADAIRAKSFATDEIPWNLATGFKEAIDTITGTGGIRIIDEPDGNGGTIRRIITDAPVPIINPPIENINFYDYDGAILYSYTPSDFLALTEMPPNPNHTAENLTAQGWNWSLSNAKEHVTKYGSLDIGQTYITADGKTHIHIFIPEDTPTNRRLFTLRWGQTVSEGVTVTWGDGTSAETFSGTSVASHDHTYTNTGEYDITLTVTSGNIMFGESQMSGGYAIYGTVSNATIYKRDYITKIEIGDNVSRIDDFSFYCCHSLQSITIPKGISYFGWYVFERCVNLTTIIFPNDFTTITEATCLYCYSLKNILLPDSITTINSKPFSYCYALTLIKSFVLKTTKNMIFSNDLNLKSVYVSDTLTTLGSSVFNSCSSLTTVTLPATLTAIGTQTFYGCYCLSAIHILATTPPTLDNSNAFTGIPSDCVIYVPYSSDHSILNAYKAATNWSSYTSYLQEEPQ